MYVANECKLVESQLWCKFILYIFSEEDVKIAGGIEHEYQKMRMKCYQLCMEMFTCYKYRLPPVSEVLNYFMQKGDLRRLKSVKISNHLSSCSLYLLGPSSCDPLFCSSSKTKQKHLYLKRGLYKYISLYSAPDSTFSVNQGLRIKIWRC